VLAGASALSLAQIERLDLDQMVARTDGVVYGEILHKEVVRVAATPDSPVLYFTGLTIGGRSLRGAGDATQVEVWFPGGFVDGTEGVHNSEAPSTDDQKVGNQVVAFYKWSDNMGGGFAGNALYASHGGLYRTFAARGGEPIVQGRGEGYAVASNRTLVDLDQRIQ
jgi:hypothetical protein